jgi:hypothetical protein
MNQATLILKGVAQRGSVARARRVYPKRKNLAIHFRKKGERGEDLDVGSSRSSFFFLNSSITYH